MIPEQPRRAQGFEPIRRPPAYEEYEGEWIAVLQGKVIAHAPKSADLLEQVRALGREGEQAVVEFVSPPSDTWLVGVG